MKKVVPAVAVSLACVVPVRGPVTRHFDPPACEKCAGHRGVTVASVAGDDVVAVAGGTIRFAGEVGGRTYVVQQVAPGVLVTYGGVVSPVGPGTEMAKGQRVAVSGDSTYLSVRVNGGHREPLRALGIGRVRLAGPGNVGLSGGSR